MNLQDYLLHLIKPLCSKPDSCKVETIVDDKGTLLKLKVDKKDMAIVIGKGGEVANAVRMLIRRVGFTLDKRVALVIEEPK